MNLRELTEPQLEAVISLRYKTGERFRRDGPEALAKRAWELTSAAMSEYEFRHPLPPNCWYGMKAKNGYPAKPDDLWVPWLCGKISDLPLPLWVRIITAWTDLLGWRVIDLHEDHGPEYLRQAVLCWLHGGHQFSWYVQAPGCFNNPFVNAPYSHCEHCPACVLRVTDANGCEVRA